MEKSETNPQPSIKSLLDRYSLRPKRTLGQNFLADAGLCSKIAKASILESGGSVLEIGAGLGALTAPLLAADQKVVAIETDAALVVALKDRFSHEIESGQLTVIEADARTLDLRQQLELLPRPRTLAGNLPYHLSGLLLRRVVEASDLLDRGVFLLQLEVVDRLCAGAGTSDYGALSVFAQAVFSPKRAFVVRRGAFYPQPNVDSAVVTFAPLQPPAAPISPIFTALVRAAFGKRRKTLRNAWRGVLNLEMDALSRAAERAGIELSLRGETLSVGAFQEMSRAVQVQLDEG